MVSNHGYNHGQHPGHFPWNELVKIWQYHHEVRREDPIEHLSDKELEKALPNFEIGAYVLAQRTQGHAGQKISPQWEGPKKIVSLPSPFVARVRDLTNNDVDDVHIRKLRYYCDHSRTSEEEMQREAEKAQEYFKVNRFVDFAIIDNEYKVRAFWVDYADDDEEGYTWEPVNDMLRDTPILLLRALRDHWPKLTPPFREYICKYVPSKYKAIFENTLANNYRKGTKRDKKKGR
eukprot:GHVU01215603.1.p1 GENE.GHVU01215603.1~~GHVU01215603.1.p1  ORF type:complete len:233 (-),score=26.33 GHVU01215603.1:65-763(-)